jgi:hypothetical protein
MRQCKSSFLEAMFLMLVFTSNSSVNAQSLPQIPELLGEPQLQLARQVPQVPEGPTTPSDGATSVTGIDQKGEGSSAASSTVHRVWTPIEIVLSIAILVFGSLVFCLQTLLMIKLKLQWTPTAILRFQGLTLIVVGSILLIAAGYSNQQILPVIGLFGTIAGYLLGATEKAEIRRE